MSCWRRRWRHDNAGPAGGADGAAVAHGQAWCPVPDRIGPAWPRDEYGIVAAMVGDSCLPVNAVTQRVAKKIIEKMVTRCLRGGGFVGGPE
jgi:hypothetical protein